MAEKWDVKGTEGSKLWQAQIQMSVGFLPDISAFVLRCAPQLTHQGCLMITSLAAEQPCAALM